MNIGNIDGIVNINNNYAGFSLVSDTPTLRNGVTANGGAIYSNDSVSLNGKTITIANNQAATHGGGIYSRNGVTINGDLFADHNTAINGSGGAIVTGLGISTSNVTINGSATLTGNLSDRTQKSFFSQGGGGISAGGAVTISGDLIAENNVAVNAAGGAIYAGGDVIANGNVSLIGNQAGYIGGAINAANVQLGGVDKTVIIANNAANISTLPYSPSSGYGGGIANQNSNTLITGSQITLSGNVAASSGGGIHSKNVTLSSPVIIANSNQAVTGNGGAINIVGGSLTTSAGSSLTLNYNQAGGSGGGIYTPSWVGNLSTLTASGNVAGVAGGAIYDGSGNLTVTDAVVLTDNLAKNGNGGALYMVAGDVNLATVSDSATVTGNIASGSGGAIYNTKNVSIGNMANVVKMDNNLAGYSVSGNIATLIPSSTANGGAISTTTGTTTLTGSAISLSGNQAANSGGGIYSKNVVLSAPVVTANNNLAVTGNGGAINVVGGSLTTTSGTSLTLNQNQAGGDGGGIYTPSWVGNFNTLTAIGNVAGKSGGAIYDASGSLTATGTVVLTDNLAKGGNGGALNILAGDVNLATVNGPVTMTGNIASGSGGAIYNTQNVSVGNANAAVKINNNLAGYSISGNTATLVPGSTANGGAIRTANTATLIGSSVDLSGNQAAYNGGAIQGTTVDITTTNGSFTAQNNIAGNSGGLTNTSTFTLRANGSGLINGNQAAQNGGALSANSAYIHALNGDISFTNNHAGQYGGAIYLNPQALTLDASGGNIAFANNTQQGGAYNAIYIVDASNSTPVQINLNATTGNGIYFFDPIQNTSTSVPALVTVTGNGLVSIDGALHSNNSSMYATTTVQGGTFEVANSAIYGVTSLTNGGTGTSTFASNAGTIIQGGNAGTIAADQISINGLLDVAGTKTAIPGTALFTLDSQATSFGARNAVHFNSSVVNTGSVSDFLLIKGDAGSGNGPMNVYVTDITPTQGTLTGHNPGDGVRIIQAVGTGWDPSSASLARGPIAKRGYLYDLFGFEEANKSDLSGNTYADSYNWYLQSDKSDHPPVYPTNNDMALRMNQMTMQNLHQRLGESSLWDKKNSDGSLAWQEGWQSWGQFVYQEGETNFANGYDYKISGAQGGIERMLRTHDGKVRQQYGFFIGHLDGSNSLNNGSNVSGTQRSTYGGAYWTWQQADQTKHTTYFDASALAGHMEYGASYYGLKDKYNGTTYAFSLETGRSFRVGKSKSLIIEPQAQLYYGWSGAEDFTAADQSNIRDSHAETLMGRLGLRIQKSYKSDGRTIAPYIRANWLKPLAGGDVTMVNDEKIRFENRESTWQVGIGITSDLSNEKWSLYAEIDRNWGGTQSWEIRGGMKVKF